MNLEVVVIVGTALTISVFFAFGMVDALNEAAKVKTRVANIRELLRLIHQVDSEISCLPEHRALERPYLEKKRANYMGRMHNETNRRS